MGPRLFSRGNGLSIPPRNASKDGFNGAATLQSRKSPQDTPTPAATCRLQWGRDSSVAEIGCSNPALRRLVASMGPRLFSRGNMLHAAADLRRRRLQWGRDSSVAEISRIGSRYTAMQAASMGPRLFSRGNWDAVDHKQRTTTASMGPRLFSRGNSESTWPESRRRYRLQWGRDSSVAEMRICGAVAWIGRWGFNGAATLQSRKCSAERLTVCYDRGRFNGAATFSRGNRPRQDTSTDMAGFNGAATLQSRKCVASAVRYSQDAGASMGPRLFSRGNLGSGHRARFAVESFNGAATLQSRKCRTDAMPVDRRRASMGPRLFSRGNRQANAIRQSRAGFNGAATLQSRKSATWCQAVRDLKLQWGRDSSVAEIGGAVLMGGLGIKCFNGAATLQSRKFLSALREAAEEIASMGPRLFSRGNHRATRQRTH